MTVQALTTTRDREQHDPYRSPGRITAIEELHDPYLSAFGGSIARIHFEDGRWLEVIGASPDWPEEV